MAYGVKKAKGRNFSRAIFWRACRLVGEFAKGGAHQGVAPRRTAGENCCPQGEFRCWLGGAGGQQSPTAGVPSQTGGSLAFLGQKSCRKVCKIAAGTSLAALCLGFKRGKTRFLGFDILALAERLEEIAVNWQSLWQTGRDGVTAFSSQAESFASGLPQFSDKTVFAGILLLTLILLMRGKLRYDFIGLLCLFLCVAFGLVPSAEAFLGFSHPAVITVAAILVLSRPLSDTRILLSLELLLRRKVRQWHRAGIFFVGDDRGFVGLYE